MRKALLLLAVLFLSACQATQQQSYQATNLCREDFGLSVGTPNFENCKKWTLHYLQTGVEPNYPEFVCQSTEGENHQSCITQQQAVYKEMMRVNEAVEAQRDKEFEQQKKEAARKAQEKKQRIEQADHQQCVSYGLKKGTKAYADCRMQIPVQKEAARQQEIRRQQEAARPMSNSFMDQVQRDPVARAALERINNYGKSNTINCQTFYYGGGANTTCQ